MREVSDRLLRAAASNSTVLILGESADGKSLLLKRFIRTARADQPLVSVNVAALPEGLVESETVWRCRWIIYRRDSGWIA